MAINSRRNWNPKSLRALRRPYSSKGLFAPDLIYNYHSLVIAIDNLKGKRENSRLRKGENLRQRKETLFKKVYKVGKYNGVDVALILHQNGQYFTYRSIDLESWPPSIKEIVRLYYSFDIIIHANVKAVSLISCS